MLPWLALTYTAARLGLEAQNAAALGLLRFGQGIMQSAANEIVPKPMAAPADVAPAPLTAARKTRHAAKKIHKKSTAVRKRRKGVKRG
jgi:hypothetical protein